MPTPTDQFGYYILNALRNPSLYFLNELFRNASPDYGSPEALAALAKLTPDDRAALLAAVTRIIDQNISGFVHALDEASNTRDGLAVTYERKPMTNGDYAFDRDLQAWHDQFAHHDQQGQPNSKAIR